MQLHRQALFDTVSVLFTSLPETYSTSLCFIHKNIVVSRQQDCTHCLHADGTLETHTTTRLHTPGGYINSHTLSSELEHSGVMKTAPWHCCLHLTTSTALTSRQKFLPATLCQGKHRYKHRTCFISIQISNLEYNYNIARRR